MIATFMFIFNLQVKGTLPPHSSKLILNLCLVSPKLHQIIFKIIGNDKVGPLSQNPLEIDDTIRGKEKERTLLSVDLHIPNLIAIVY